LAVQIPVSYNAVLMEGNEHHDPLVVRRELLRTRSFSTAALGCTKIISSNFDFSTASAASSAVVAPLIWRKATQVSGVCWPFTSSRTDSVARVPETGGRSGLDTASHSCRPCGTFSGAGTPKRQPECRILRLPDAASHLNHDLFAFALAPLLRFGRALTATSNAFAEASSQFGALDRHSSPKRIAYCRNHPVGRSSLRVGRSAANSSLRLSLAQHAAPATELRPNSVDSNSSARKPRNLPARLREREVLETLCRPAAPYLQQEQRHTENANVVSHCSSSGANV